ncbi:hypothetical protein C0Q72_07970 [Klebsiella pneumoniae]|nr:hypothetical protein [Klebsiella pneumoniae]MBX4681660.1 hypothetical protein [Klebsiella pneumoniae]
MLIRVLHKQQLIKGLMNLVILLVCLLMPVTTLLHHLAMYDQLCLATLEAPLVLKLRVLMLRSLN